MIKMKTSPPGNKGTTAASSFEPFRHEDKRGQRNFELNLLVLSCRYKGMLPFNNYIYEVCVFFHVKKTINGVIKMVNGRKICCSFVSLMDFLIKRVEIRVSMQTKIFIF